MAPKSKKGKTVDKWRKKKYFSVLAPKVFQERELGQSIAYDSTSLQGRPLTTNLMVLTGNVKKQDINITFKVINVKGDTAFTRVDKYLVSAASIKRKVRRGRDRIDESFHCVTKDNKIIRMKPLVVTGVKTSRSVRTAVRNDLLLYVVNVIRKMDYDSLVMEVINEKLQRETAFRLRKILPIRFVDIRMMQYVGDQKSADGAVADEVKAEKAKPAIKLVQAEAVKPVAEEVDEDAEPETAPVA